MWYIGSHRDKQMIYPRSEMFQTSEQTTSSRTRCLPQVGDSLIRDGRYIAAFVHTYFDAEGCGGAGEFIAEVVKGGQVLAVGTAPATPSGDGGPASQAAGVLAQVDAEREARRRYHERRETLLSH